MDNFVYMRDSHDCFQCCVAYITHRPWGHVSRTAARRCAEDWAVGRAMPYGPRFWQPWYRWMRDHGWQLRASFFPEGGCELLPETDNYDWIARVQAPMGSHAVIFRGNEFLYDPDDFAEYTLDDVTAWYAIEPLGPPPYGQGWDHLNWHGEFVLGNRGWGRL